MVYIQCTNDCSNNSCLSECARVFSDCNNSCPCSDQCPNGCEDCPNPICVCGLNPSQQNVDNLKNCTGVNSMDLGQCILDCKGGNKACDESCVDDFRTQHQSCPCQVRQYSILLLMLSPLMLSPLKLEALDSREGLMKKILFRMAVNLVVLAIILNVNQIRNLSWFWIHGLKMAQFL